MTGIRVVNALEVGTDIGKCFIELCIGDITALPKHDEVDVLVLSAFPGDYSPTPSSLIGQLSMKLGVSIRQLAKDKEEDLRKLYSCWWSKPLPEHLSFRKILCFEGGGRSNRSVGQVVGDVFRCLVPILANNEGKVIMPILASGDQRKSKTKMLKLLMDAAIHWMKAGLPLRSLKIVIFSRNIENISTSDQPLFDLFQKLKDIHEQSEEKEDKEVEVESAEYDIYLSYSEEDVKCVDQVVDVLVKKKTNIRVFSSVQKLDLETSWQTQLYDVIKKCTRVMALITPSFLQSERCTEQYNIALCHSRKTQERVLIPLYVSEVPYMPTYMRITQYIDCRISFQEKLNAACLTVIGSLSCEEVTTKADKQDKLAPAKPASQTYDVFLSYSHCNTEYAKQIMKEMRTEKPDLNIFIDTAELKAGGAWQLTLYNALDCSKFFIALISNDYLQSKVCNEEICLSIALQLQNNCKIWPLVIEPLQKNIEWLNMLSPVNCYKDGGEKSSNSISFVRNQFLAAFGGDKGNAEDIVKISLQSCLEEARSLFFEKDFVSLVADTPINTAQDKVPTLLPKDPNCDVDIYIICSLEDEECCSLLHNCITSQNDSFVVKISTKENASTRLTYLDKARLVIPLLSASFLQSSELLHELNIAWCRQRDCSSLCFLAIVLEQLPKNPTYVSLFPCFFNCEDNVWTKDLETLDLFSSDELTRAYQSCECPLNVLLCFMIAIRHIQRWHDGEHCTVLGIHNKLFNCLQLNMCIQRYNEILSKRDNKEENGATVVSCTRSKECNTESMTIPSVQDEGNQRDSRLDGLQDVDQKVEHDYVEQNEDRSEDQIPPKDVNLAEERNTCLPTADLEGNAVKANQQGTSNASCALPDIHQDTHDKEAIDMNEEKAQSMPAARNKSSACIII